MKNLQLPFGVQDYMPQECYNKNLTQEKLAETFVQHGFVRVETPAIEYYNVYDEILSRAAVHKTFKMTDSDGSLLILRPDPTLQICRMAAAKLQSEGIHKVYYLENSYEYLSDPSTARSREFAQAGVELLGTSGTAGDVEIIVVAIESLLAAGLDDFLLEIGQVAYFNGLTSEAGMTENDAETLRALVNKKDMLGVELFLHGKNVDERFVSRFLKLPTLFGGAEVLARAREGVANEKSEQALNNLQEIMEKLTALGLDRYVSIDLGLLRGDYYTGLVMKGFSGKLGVPLLDGGRYDRLGQAFGKTMPAVGFSVGIKRLLIALEKEGKLIACKTPDYAYISDGKDSAHEYAVVSDLRKKGNNVEKCFYCKKSELIAYCKQKGIRHALIFTGGKMAQTEVTK